MSNSVHCLLYTMLGQLVYIHNLTLKKYSMLQNQIKDKCTKYFLHKNGWPISLDLQIEHICRQPVGHALKVNTNLNLRKSSLPM